jgi:hypothetical protein
LQIDIGRKNVIGKGRTNRGVGIPRTREFSYLPRFGGGYRERSRIRCVIWLTSPVAGFW